MDIPLIQGFLKRKEGELAEILLDVGYIHLSKSTQSVIEQSLLRILREGRPTLECELLFLDNPEFRKVVKPILQFQRQLLTSLAPLSCAEFSLSPISESTKSEFIHLIDLYMCAYQISRRKALKKIAHELKLLDIDKEKIQCLIN